MISVIVPVYRGENFIEELTARIHATMDSILEPYEIIMINDASPDNSWEKIEMICANNKNIKGIHLSRNFGQHYAISAGLDHANGDWIVVMDCDLQDKPEEIPKLYSKAREGFDVVQAVRIQRKDKSIKIVFSILFYQILSWLTGIKYDYRIANFGIYKRKVISSILNMGDSIRYFPSMIKWVGFRSSTVTVIHGERNSGGSSYNFRRLMHLALDIILSYSDKPIRMAIKGGLFISLISVILALYTLFKAISGKIDVPGYASLIVSIWFLSGLIIAIIGIVGLYVSKTFQAVRRRPVYIISEKVNLN